MPSAVERLFGLEPLDDALGDFATEKVAGTEALAIGHDPPDAFPVRPAMLDPVRAAARAQA